MSDLNLPLPKLTIPCEPGKYRGGMYYIVPVRLMGYEKGWRSIIEDIYEHTYFISGIDDKGHPKIERELYVFSKRVRKYSKPLNGDMTPHSCPVCIGWWKLYPTKEDEILLNANEMEPSK